LYRAILELAALDPGFTRKIIERSRGKFIASPDPT
jgi:hypothetical protein